MQEKNRRSHELRKINAAKENQGSSPLVPDLAPYICSMSFLYHLSPITILHILMPPIHTCTVSRL